MKSMYYSSVSSNKKAIYTERIKRLREIKLRETKMKVKEEVYLDEDDYNYFSSPEGYSWEPPFKAEDGEFYGYTMWAANYEDMLRSFPPVVIPQNSMAGNFYRMLSRFRKKRIGTDWGLEDLYPQIEKYDIVSGLGAENHFCGDVRIGFKLGWGGLLEKVRHYAATNSDTDEKKEFYAAEEKTLLAIIDWIRRTSDEIRHKLELEKDEGLRTNLKAMLETNEWVTLNPPRTLREACQFFCWYNLAGRSFNRDGAGGQLDELLRPFYEKDIGEGLIDDEDTIYYIAGLLMSDTKYYQLGGPDINGEDMVSHISWLILEAADRMNISVNLTIRVHDKINHDFFHHAVELLFKHKSGWPRFSGDDSLVKGLVARGFPEELARKRIAVGCNWMAIPGTEYGRNDCIKINMAKTFEVAYFDMVANEYKYSTKMLWVYFKKHLKEAVRIVAESNDKHLQYQRFNAPELFLNLFCYGPVEKGCDASYRTLEYYNIGIDGAGIAVVADSFAAIEQRVEREKRLTWTELNRALASNFECEKGALASNCECENGKYIQALLKSAEKYGQWNSIGERWAKRTSKTFSDIVINQEAPEEKYVKFIPGLFSWSQTILLGKSVGATPNSRKAGTPINHSANPFPGSLKNGAMTTMSEAIISVQCGMGNTSPFQMELDPGISEAENGVEKVMALLETHLKRGGTLINVNIIDADKILAANKNPELYPDLVVRVTGFTAYFITLSPEFRQLVVDRIMRA